MMKQFLCFPGSNNPSTVAGIAPISTYFFIELANKEITRREIKLSLLHWDFVRFLQLKTYYFTLKDFAPTRTAGLKSRKTGIPPHDSYNVLAFQLLGTDISRAWSSEWRKTTQLKHKQLAFEKGIFPRRIKVTFQEICGGCHTRTSAKLKKHTQSTPNACVLALSSKSNNPSAGRNPSRQWRPDGLATSRWAPSRLNWVWSLVQKTTQQKERSDRNASSFFVCPCTILYQQRIKYSSFSLQKRTNNK